VNMAQSKDPPRPEIQIVFEGDAEKARPDFFAQDGDKPQPTSHVVGNDRLAALVGAVSDTVDELREQRLAVAMAGSGRSLHGFFPERVAQVIQATKAPLDLVLALLSDGIAAETALKLDDTRPTVKEGVASFSGKLRVPGPFGSRPVDLRVYPTASANLTVLELMPQRRWIPQTARYLRTGVPTVTRLTDLIEAGMEAHDA
jgi:hypothetical protein